MFIKMMMQGANTDEEYKRKLEGRQKLSRVTLLMGIAHCIFPYLYWIQNILYKEKLTDTPSYLLGLGGSSF